MLRVDARSSREIQAAIAAMRAAGKDLRKDLHAAVRKEVGGLWLPELRSRSTGRQDEAVIVRGARVASRTDGFTLIAARSNRIMRGGLVPRLDWYKVELGAHSKRGSVTRRTKSGTTSYTALLGSGVPDRDRGRVANPAASKIGRRAVAIWVRTIVDTYRKAAGDTR